MIIVNILLTTTRELSFLVDLSWRSKTLVIYFLTTFAGASLQWFDKCSSSFETSPRFQASLQYLHEAENLPGAIDCPWFMSSQIVPNGLPPLFFG